MVENRPKSEIVGTQNEKKCNKMNQKVSQNVTKTAVCDKKKMVKNGRSTKV